MKASMEPQICEPRNVIDNFKRTLQGIFEEVGSSLDVEVGSVCEALSELRKAVDCELQDWYGEGYLDGRETAQPKSEITDEDAALILEILDSGVELPYNRDLEVADLRDRIFRSL